MGKSACLVCGKPLCYREQEQELICVWCGQPGLSRASCEDGHYICDQCHAERGIADALEVCQNTASKDPIAIVQEMMDCPFVYMHGNEHHVMVGAALLTAYHNAGGAVDLETALEEMRARGSQYPGGSCGFWGACGAAVSTGMFLSIITGTTPLSEASWGAANRITAKALDRIGALGGPRCCKRNSFTAILATIQFVKETYGVAMDYPKRVVCRYSPQNEQCLRERCPYYDRGFT